MTDHAAAADASEADSSSQQLLHESDFSTSSVDRFLREHGFDIDDHAGLELSSLSDDDDDDGDHDIRTDNSTERNAHMRLGRDTLRIDTSAGAGEASAHDAAAAVPSAALAMRSSNRDDHARNNDDNDDARSMSDRTIGDRASSSSAHQSLLDGGQSASEEEEPVTPRFTLLHEKDLLLVDGAGHSTASAPIAELPELELSHDGSDRAQRTPQTQQQVETDADHRHRDSLDRSMVLGAGSGFSGFSSDATDERSRIAQTLHEEAHDVRASLQPPPSVPRQSRPRPLVSRSNSALSSSVSGGESFTSGSRRVQDDELSDALGVTVSTPERDASSRISTSRVSELRRFGAAASGRQASTGTRTSQRTLFATREDETEQQEEHKESERPSFAYPPAVPRIRSASVPSVARRDTSAAAGVQDISDSSSNGWSALNDKLRQHGLQTIAFETVDVQTLRANGSTDVTLPHRESLLNLIQDVVLQLERKDQIIQDIILESNRSSREQSRAEGDLASVEKKNEVIQSALERAKAEVVRLQAKLRQSRDDADAQAKTLKQSCLRLQQQLKVSEHRVKAKEVLVERMQVKLQQHVDRESLSKSRDRHAVHQLQQRDGKKPSAQALECISMYEAQREELEDEVSQLKAQVAALNAELRDKENYIARKAVAAMATWDTDDGNGNDDDARSPRRQRPSLSSTVSDDMMLERLEAARREQEQAASALRRREAAMLKKVRTIEQELVHARETIAELKDENANLVLDAESRPSIRDYRLCQRRIHQLERQVSESKLALEEATDLHELRKYMGTKELMERDRLNHRLHLNRLNSLPRETTLEVVKDVCRVLHLTDITLIAPSLEKLCRVVAAVPRMEKFIRDVCGFVFLYGHSREREREDGDRAAGFELEQVLPTLQQWTVERRKLDALESFQAAIVSELCKRSIEPSVLSSTADAGHSPSQPASLARAVHIVSELIELEKSVLHHREIYTQAAAEIERRPSVLVNQIVRHFSHLFQVKSVDGVLPKINEIYLFVNEMENFLNVIRGLFHLKPHAPVTVCLNAIRDKLERDERPQSPAQEPSRENSDPNAHELPNFVVAKKKDATVSGVNGSHDLAGVRQVREMTILVRDLKRELGAASMQEILPRTKRLMELLSLSINNNNASFDNDDDDDGDDHGY